MIHAPILPFIILAACVAPFSVAHAQVRHEYSEVHMGMPVRIVVHAADDSTARTAARAAFARIAALDAMMSDYRPDSEVRRVGERSGTWVPVSVELFDVVSRALDIARACDGAFDPTIGPLVDLWRETRRTRRLPSPADLDAARALVNWRLVALDTTRRAIRLDRPGMRLDLGGIAKGYILGAATETMRQLGARAVLAEAGGDVVVGDAPPGRAGWTVEVPGADSAFVRRAAALTNAAISSSGPTFQFVEIDGVRYSHVLDPRTGLGSTSPRITHVIAPDGATADAVSTAVSVLDGDAGRLLAMRLKVALWLTRVSDEDRIEDEPAHQE